MMNITQVEIKIAVRGMNIGQVERFAVGRKAGVIFNAAFAPLRPVLKLIEHNLFRAAPFSIEGNIPGPAHHSYWFWLCEAYLLQDFARLLYVLV